MIIGSSHALSASDQLRGSTTYQWSSWSDGGAASHSIVAPATATTYTATFTGTTWSSQDVGAVGAAGSWSLSGDVYSVTGSGADIWTTVDEFRYVYRNITGDATITARLTGLPNTNAWAKAGIMIRDGLAANARNVALLATPTAGEPLSVPATDDRRRCDHRRRRRVRGNPGLAPPRALRQQLHRVPLDQRDQLDAAIHPRDDDPAGHDPVRSRGHQPRRRDAEHVDLPERHHHAVVTDPTPGTDRPGGHRGQHPGQPLLVRLDVGAPATTSNAPPPAAGRTATSATGVTATSFTNTGLTNGTTYHYVVSAVNSAGESPNSAQASATPVASSGCQSVALSRSSATASSLENAMFPASNAIDASLTTRWSSQFSDPQWIYVDLGASRRVNRVVLNWEAAASANYTVELSTSTSGPWTSLIAVPNGNGGIDDLSFTGGAGRYVRMFSTARTTIYGNSLFDFAVYGDNNPSCTP